MDIYRDYFTREELLLSLQTAQFIPGMLGADGLFETLGLTGTTFAAEALPSDDVSEATAQPRGAPARPLALEKRTVRTFTVASYSWQRAVLADEVLNMRGAGTTGIREVLQTRRDRATAKLRRQADFQHEYLRIACLNSATNTFGSAPAAAVVAFGPSDSGTREAIHTNVVLVMEAALGGIHYTGLTAYCSDTYWVALIGSKTIRETYLNQIAASELRNAPSDQFDYGGITWKRYRAGGNIAITSGQAKVVPNGVPGLFVQAFAPNDTLDSVGEGQMGQPYFLDSFPLEDNKGIRLALSTHPVMVCTRPTAVVTVDLS